jgi:Cytidylate kinase-like family
MQDAVAKSGSFVASQWAGPSGRSPAKRTGLAGPVVTISHQTGAGAQEVGGQLAAKLEQTEAKGPRPWTVLDRQLVERALEEHHWPRHLVNKMPEDRRTYVDDVLDDLFGLRPPSWVLVPQVVETMLHVAEAGHVVLIGRGATVVTASLPNVFHVRLVASLATRIKRVCAARSLSAEAAARFVEKEDRGRQRYTRANFHVRIEDELLYHMVINTDRLSYSDAAAVIAEGAVRCFKG